MNRALALAFALAAVGCGHSNGASNGGADAGPPACTAGLEAGSACTPGSAECFQCVNGDGFDCTCESDSGVEAPDASIWFCVGTGYVCP